MGSFIGNVVIGSPFGSWNDKDQRVEGEPRQLGAFYAELLGMNIIRDDWIKVGVDRDTYPQLAFGDGWSDEAPPNWPDPDRPQQMHIDITVPGLDDAESLVLRLGGRRLQDAGESRTFADPFGHPFCLSEGDDRRIARVVIDCFSPRSLAVFYERLLGMHRVHDSPDLVVIAGEERGVAGWPGMPVRTWTAPLLAFQHAPEYVAPRWGDPAHPQQLHLDIWFERGDEAVERAESLGAIRLPSRANASVYADPAGHPLCLLRPGQ